MAESEEVSLLRDMNRLVSVMGEDTRNLKTNIESLIQTTTSHVTSETIRQMDVFVLAIDTAEIFQKIGFRLRASAEGMQKTIESLSFENYLTESEMRKLIAIGSNDSQKEEEEEEEEDDDDMVTDEGNLLIVCALLAEIAEKLQEQSFLLKSMADMLQKAAESLIPDHLSSESRKRKLNVDDSNELQKEEVDDKCVQDQLDVDGYENFHADRLSTSADLAGKSVAEQRQITEAEWVLLSENSRRSYIERGDTGEEGQPGPSKKRRVN